MKKITFLVHLFIITFAAQNSYAQRYLTEVFSDIKITDNVEYGQNKTIITGTPVLIPLNMTVYEPDNDTTTQRPLFIYVHTGSFLPKNVNGQPTGDRTDSAVVEICTRLAKRGYVAAAISYRQGWNPVDPSDDGRKGSLLRAVYRVIQDTRTATRFFRKNIATGGNTFGVNTNKIAVIGQGSGGYVAFAGASLDKLTEIQMTKFYDFSIGAPYVDPAVLGDFDGIGGSTTFNNDNHVGYSSEIQFAVNLGGAMGDSSWLEMGDVPMVSFHCKFDPFAPYATGTVIVPTTGAIVLEDAAGSYTVQKLTNQFGNNDDFVDAAFTDVYTTRANTINNGYEGLFPFVTSTIQPQGAPWEWWSSSEPTDSLGLLTNPDMSKTKAMLYIDTIMGYLSPRANVGFVEKSTSIKETNHVAESFMVYPNPSKQGFVMIQSKGSAKINSISISNISGQTIKKISTLNDANFYLNTTDFTKGLYFVTIQSENSTATHKIIIE